MYYFSKTNTMGYEETGKNKENIRTENTKKRRNK
jgi:hypothetical protein